MNCLKSWHQTRLHKCIHVLWAIFLKDLHHAISMRYNILERKLGICHCWLLMRIYMRNGRSPAKKTLWTQYKSLHQTTERVSIGTCHIFVLATTSLMLHCRWCKARSFSCNTQMHRSFFGYISILQSLETQTMLAFANIEGFSLMNSMLVHWLT